MKRNKSNLSKRIPQQIERNRLSIEEIQQFYKNHQLLSEDLEPEQIYNMDETGFCCSPGRDPIFCRRGAKNAFTFVSNANKQQYTIVNCINAADEYLPALILSKGTEGSIKNS
jgi:hypothetical protein